MLTALIGSCALAFGLLCYHIGWRAQLRDLWRQVSRTRVPLGAQTILLDRAELEHFERALWGSE